MFQYFPKIYYNLEGQTLQFTNIFKTVKVNFSNPEYLPTTEKIVGERPDQLSTRLYNSSNYYWTLFFANQIKNPLKEWNVSEEQYTKIIETDYNELTYQFANTSKYLPPVESIGYFGNDNDRYNGTDFSDIQTGDLIIIETGNGPYSVRCLGAGIIIGDPVYGEPHYGQSIIPDDFDNQNNIKQASCGRYFSTCLDNDGYIYAWGEEIGLDLSPNGFNTKTSKGLYKSSVSGYTFIDSSGSRIVAVTSTSGLTCFGDCTDFNSYYSGETGFVKTYWTSGNAGGLGIKSNGTPIYYGFSGPSGISFHDADCGFDYCVGIELTDYGLTGWSETSPSSYTSYFPAGVTGFIAIACGISHNLGLLSTGELYGFGISAEGRTVVPSGTYKKISAGKFHSAALNTDNELQIWGKITTRVLNPSGFAGSDYVPGTVQPSTISGTYSLLASGFDHILLTSYGTAKKYIGVINSIDSLYKKINVIPYQYPDVNLSLVQNPELDPSSSVVSVWRFNQSTQQYDEVKTIQNKFLTIQKYLDSVLYIQVAGNLLDPTNQTNWNSYLQNYQNSNNIDGYITLRKQLLDENIYNNKQIKYLSKSDVQILESSVNSILNDSTITDITITQT